MRCKSAGTLAVVVVALIFAGSARAQTATAGDVPPPPPVATAGNGGVPATATAVAATAQPAATQNTITTTAPVSSNTTISVGTIAGEALDWAVIAFGGTLTGFGVQLLRKLAQKAGVELSDKMSQQLNETLLNGLNAAAARAETAMAGKAVVDIKSQIIADAITYAQDHRADTIKKLGLDPQTGTAVLALRARIDTLVADPAKPTPAVLDAASPKAA